MIPRRFWQKVMWQADGCWIWTGSRSSTGYGTFNLGKGKYGLAHRLSFSWLVGAIPADYEVDHLCRVKACVNPRHLDAVTPLENTRRAICIGHDHPNSPTTCKWGHDWQANPPYVATRPSGKTSRECRVCHREREARRNAMLRGDAA